MSIARIPRNAVADVADDELPSLEVKRAAKAANEVPSGAKTPSTFIQVDAHGVRRFAGYVVPPEAVRIKVLDCKGQQKLRKLEDLQAGDTAMLGDNGLPVFIEGRIGKPPMRLSDAMPAASPLIGDLLRIKEAHLRNDPIIQAAETTPESSEVLNQVLLAIGEEAASMRFERMEAERKGEETSSLSMRRVAALKAIGDTWIKRKEQINSRVIDMESPSFQTLFQFISETFTHAMQQAGVRKELSDSVIAQFVKLLDDSWKSEATSRMKE